MVTFVQKKNQIFVLLVINENFLILKLWLLPPEDNNTRVLFERVLTSGSLSPEKSG